MRERLSPDFIPSQFVINDLPPELLAEVFYSYILLVVHRKPSSTSPAPYSWIVIRHVCRAWRAVALAHPKLSSHIHLLRPECVQHMLRTSGAAPLHVYEQYRSVSPSGIVTRVAMQRDVFGHLERIVSARADLRTTAVLDLGPPGQVKSSALRSLVLEIPHQDADRAELVPPLWPGFTFPRLDEFHGRAMDIYLFSPIIPTTLRVLTIDYCFPKDTLTELVAMLGTLSRLEELTASNLTYWPEQLLPEVRRLHPCGTTATLQRLTRISISGDTYEVGRNLLQRLILPTTAQVHQIYDMNMRDPPFLPPSPFLATLGGANSPAPQSLLVRTDGFETLTLHLWDTPLPLHELRARAKSPNDRSARFAFTKCSASVAFVEELLQRVPLGAVRVAHLEEGRWQLVPFPWHAVLAQFVALEELSVECEVPRQVDEAYIESGEASNLADAARMFPALESVLLCHSTRRAGAGHGSRNFVSLLRVMADRLRTRTDEFRGGLSVSVQAVAVLEDDESD
ncbi:hypothetical protein PsYK624_053380 [Phanerochaete sordida]|uniref:F-box domain-containing protein n=1 Tax=Phanerochaete sordida TaxID=48140 RepID=A0A9P3G4Y0_9APHY|nr:hypothetical protein PsYK624_053380 [Phanerochaete sordida]